MKKSKTAVMALFSCLILLFMNCGVLFAAPAKDAKYSVDAEEIEYDMESGDGTAAGKTTIKHDGGTAVAQKGATFNSKNRTGHLLRHPGWITMTTRSLRKHWEARPVCLLQTAAGLRPGKLPIIWKPVWLMPQGESIWKAFPVSCRLPVTMRSTMIKRPAISK